MTTRRRSDRTTVNDVIFNLRWSTGLRERLEGVREEEETLASVIRLAVEREIAKRLQERLKGTKRRPRP